MLERLRDLPAGVDGLRLSGTVTRADYDAVMLPLFEEARREGRRIRLLVRVGSDFQGASAGGAWEGMRIGVHHLRRLERCAVVSDNEWVRAATQIKSMASFLLSCPIKAFHENESELALSFLTAPEQRPPMPFRLIANKGILVLEPEAALRAEDFEAVAAAIDPWIEAHGALRGVIIRAREFPGWKDMAGLMSHLRFVRDHERKVRRVAIVVDGLLAGAAEALAAHFIAADVKHFEFDEFDDAVAWAEKGTEASTQESTHRLS